jgi:hypothetical protein
MSGSELGVKDRIIRGNWLFFEEFRQNRQKRFPDPARLAVANGWLGLELLLIFQDKSTTLLSEVGMLVKVKLCEINLQKVGSGTRSVWRLPGLWAKKTPAGIAPIAPCLHRY